MRIALLPLDSRPPNWQFPQRLASIAGIELVLPPREQLGTLARGADGLALARWLVEAAPRCDAAVFSYDALIYGGLVQSRRLDLPTTTLDALEAELARIDWQKTKGYAYLTLPRLGVTADSADAQATHAAVREYFIQWGKAENGQSTTPALAAAEKQLGAATIERLWQWRERNKHNAQAAMRLSAKLGLSLFHAALEDNAPAGPHLKEAEELKQLSLELIRERRMMHFSLFDGADECAALLLARAAIDHSGTGALPVGLTVHPRSPGPDRYTGLYESHTLNAGLEFLSRLLRLAYYHDDQGWHWLVTHGVQPQPDVYASDPGQAFSNPYLLPKELPGGAPLLVTDLAACNGANPRLVTSLAALAPHRLFAVVGFNTNFNALGLSAAWLRLFTPTASIAQARRFALERLADDVVYQSIARPYLRDYLKGQGLSEWDFSQASVYQLQECTRLVEYTWQQWREGDGAPVLLAMGIPHQQAASLRFSFPWQRAFEVEAEAAV